MAQQLPEGHQPASWEDAISAIAKANGVPPMLAVAVARKESNLNPDAIGDGDLEGGASLGLFQLRPATAKMLGVDPSDPVQNITGGVKYLKQLSDQYGGDVTKALMAYNGGPEHIERGDVSPAAQAYAAAVIASLSQGVREATTVQPAISHPTDFKQFGPMSELIKDQALGPSPESRAIMHGLDPRNPEGRQNIAGAIGGAIGTYMTGGLATLPGVLPWVARVIGPALHASVAGATEAAAEQVAGTAPADPNAVVKAGGAQAAYEVGGQMLTWLPRHIGKWAAGTRLAREMKGFFRATEESAAAGFRAEKEALKDESRAAMDTIRDTSAQRVSRAKSEATEFVESVKRAGVEASRASHARTADRLADLELQTAKDIADAKGAYDALLANPPSVTGAASAARDVLGGLPGLHTGTIGPAKIALDRAGQRVSDAANQPGSIDAKPIRQALFDMVREAFPSAIAAKPRQVGFSSMAVQPNKALTGGATSGDLTALQKAVQKALGVSEGQEVAHPIKGVLERAWSLPDTISFADAQALKQLLDESVNYDKAAKKVLERMTKGVRKTLRESMSAIPGYDEATSNYARLASLYRKGVGAKLIKDAADNPDRVAQVLKPDQPENAAKIRDLLVTQSAEGGDPEKGLLAWNAIRSAYTYQNVLQGGIKDLSKRVHELVETQPEFARIVFGDEAAQRILSNLDKIGMAYTEAASKGVEASVTAKALGAAEATEVADVGRQAATTAKESAQGLVERAKTIGREDLRRTAQRYADRKTALRETEVTAGEKLKDAESAFKASSIGRFANVRSNEQMAADAVRLLLPRTLNKSLAVVRWLEGPLAKDLIYYSALSDRGTQRIVNILLNRTPDRAVASWVREMLPMVVGNPAASHEPVTK